MALVSRFVTTCSMRVRSHDPSTGPGIETSIAEPVSFACSRSRPVTSRTRSSSGTRSKRSTSRPAVSRDTSSRSSTRLTSRSVVCELATSARPSFSSLAASRGPGSLLRPDRRRQPQLQRRQRRLQLVRRDGDELVARADGEPPLGQRRGQRHHADRGDRQVDVGHQQALVDRARGEVAARHPGRRDRHGGEQDHRAGDAALLEAQRRPDQQRA